MRRKLLILITLVTVLGGMISPTIVQADTDGEPSNIQIEITEGWYADGEGDGKENDAFVTVRFHISSYYYFNVFDYIITLTLPSGASDSYMVRVYTNMEVVEITNNFWNHATELGWYDVEVTAQLYTPELPSDTESFTFDPPGGDNSDPKSFSV